MSNINSLISCVTSVQLHFWCVSVSGLVERSIFGSLQTCQPHSQAPQLLLMAAWPACPGSCSCCCCCLASPLPGPCLPGPLPLPGWVPYLASSCPCMPEALLGWVTCFMTPAWLDSPLPAPCLSLAAKRFTAWLIPFLPFVCLADWPASWLLGAWQPS